MPPLTKAPGSYYSEIGTTEFDSLFDRAQSGEFDPWAAVAEDRPKYVVWSIRGELPQVALLALQEEIGQSITAQQTEALKVSKNIRMLGSTSILNT
jgi:hypothetical protein